MKVKIKKLHKDALIPSYAKDGDGGMDITAIDRTELFVKTGMVSSSIGYDHIGYEHRCLQYIEYRTGLSIEIPEGYVGLIYPRSSISKTNLLLANSVGVIDSGYRGEILIRFKVLPYADDTAPHIYDIGEKIAQLIIVPIPKIELEEVESLSKTERGDGGFGSTGK